MVYDKMASMQEQNLRESVLESQPLVNEGGEESKENQNEGGEDSKENQKEGGVDAAQAEVVHQQEKLANNEESEVGYPEIDPQGKCLPNFPLKSQHIISIAPPVEYKPEQEVQQNQVYDENIHTLQPSTQKAYT